MYGISSTALRKTLEEWPAGLAKPKFLYTVPVRSCLLTCFFAIKPTLQNGSNPSGMSTTVDRRKDILSLAREHNFIIFEGLSNQYLR